MAKNKTKIARIRIKKLPGFQVEVDTGDHIGELEFPEVKNNAFFRPGIELLKKECGISPGIDLYSELKEKVDEAVIRTVINQCLLINPIEQEAIDKDYQ